MLSMQIWSRLQTLHWTHFVLALLFLKAALFNIEIVKLITRHYSSMWIHRCSENAKMLRVITIGIICMFLWAWRGPRSRKKITEISENNDLGFFVIFSNFENKNTFLRKICGWSLKKGQKTVFTIFSCFCWSSNSPLYWQ